MKVLRNKGEKKEAKASFSLKLHEQKEQNFVMIREVREREFTYGVY